MKSLVWQILCYTLFCKSDEQVNPWVSVSGQLSLHSEQDPNPGTEKKLYLKMMLSNIFQQCGESNWAITVGLSFGFTTVRNWLSSLIGK